MYLGEKKQKKQHGRQHNMVVGWLRFNKANRTRGNMPIASERPCFQDILTISAAKLTRHSRRTLKNAFCQHNQSSSKVQITMHSRLTRQEQRVPKIFIGKSTHEPLLMCSSNARPKRANLRWNGGSGCRILNRLNIVVSAAEGGRRKIEKGLVTQIRSMAMAFFHLFSPLLLGHCS
jgi:hypothetical protein